MKIVSITGKPAEIQLSDDPRQINLQWEKRRELTTQYSELISISNPKREQFIAEAEQLFSKYYV